ncbi:MAG: DNA repair protein RecO [Oscillospiraceae bacterium]
MNTNTKGIVIKEIAIGDSDKMLHILTDTLGVISCVAKNAKNIKNRLVTSTSLLTYSEFSLYKKKDMYIANKADTIKVFYKLKEDIEVLSLSMYFCEIADFLSPKNESDDRFLRLILNSLYILETKKINLKQLKFIYELKLMCFIGYTPNFSGCSICKTTDEDFFNFDIENGNLQCDNCMNKSFDKLRYIRLDITMLKAIIHVIVSDFNKLYGFTVNEDIANRLTHFSESFLLYYNDKTFKTLSFLKTIIN